MRAERKDRDHFIAVIECLYPPDSQYETTRNKGQGIMLAALEDFYENWRDLPDSVLQRMADLCEWEDRAADRKL